MEMYDDENNEWIPMPSLNDSGDTIKAVQIPWRLAKATISRKVPNNTEKFQYIT